MYRYSRTLLISLALVLSGVATQQAVVRMAALAVPTEAGALVRAASNRAAVIPPVIRKVMAKRVYTVQGTRQAAARLRLAPQEGTAGQVAFQVSLSSTLPISPLLTTITATLQRGVEPPLDLALSQPVGQLLAQPDRLVQWQRRTAPGQLDLTVAIQATATPATTDETWWLRVGNLPSDATTTTTLAVTSATGTIAQIEVDPQVIIDSLTYSVGEPLPDQVTLRGYSVRVVEPSAGVASDCARVALHWQATAGSNPAIPPITTITTTELVGLGLACVAQGRVQQNDITGGGRYTYTLQATVGVFGNQAQTALVVNLPPAPTMRPIRVLSHSAAVVSAQWSKDESRVLTLSADGSAHIWDASSSRESNTLTGLDYQITSAVWSTDDRSILVMGCYHSFAELCVGVDTIRIWDTVTGTEAELFSLNANYFASQTTWSKDGQRLLIVGCEGLVNSCPKSVQIRDVRTNTIVREFTEQGRDISLASWSNDEKRILLHSCDKISFFTEPCPTGATYIRDIATEESIKLEGAAPHIGLAVWSQDDSKLLTSSRELIASGVVTMPIWADSRFRWPDPIPQPSDPMPWWVDPKFRRVDPRFRWSDSISRWVDPTSRWVDPTPALTGITKIWDSATGKVLVELTELNASIKFAVWSQDDRKILTHSHDGTVQIWDASTGKELVKLAGAHGNLDLTEWSKDEKRILTIPDCYANFIFFTNPCGSTVRIWDANTGRLLAELAGHGGAIASARWSQDGSKILTSSADYMAVIWSAATDAPEVFIPRPDAFLLEQCKASCFGNDLTCEARCFWEDYCRKHPETNGCWSIPSFLRR